jgi:protein TonB
MKMNYRKITGKRIVRFSMIMLSLILFWKCENFTKDSELNADSDALLEADIQQTEILDVAKVVEVMPEPEEGLEGFLNYIGKNIKYPEEARKQGIEGKVFVRFVITKNGSISQVEVIKGMGYGLDEEAARVVSAYQKKWKPGINKGEKVNTEMVLPINYAL